MRRNLLPRLLTVLLLWTAATWTPLAVRADGPVIVDGKKLPEGLAEVIEKQIVKGPGHTILENDHGKVYAPGKLARTHPVLLVVSQEADAPAVEALKRRLGATGVIVAVPVLAETDGQFYPAGTMKNFDALVKALRAKRKIPTGRIWVLGAGEDAGHGLTMALDQAARISGLVLIGPDRIERDKKQLAGGKGLAAVIIQPDGEDEAQAAVARKNKETLEDAGWQVELELDKASELEKVLASRAQAILERTIPEEDEDVRVETIAQADALYNKGKYRQAVKAYKGFADEEQIRISAAIGLARALQATGQYAEAVEALQAVGKDAQQRSDWQLAVAEALRHVGKYEQALKHAQTANRLWPKWAPALLIQGELLETLGRKEQAQAVYKKMTEITAAGGYENDARQLVALGQIYDRYATLTGLRASEQASNILHNYLQEAYQKVDKDYWPAHVATGMFLLSKHRPTGAAEEFKLALKKNPRAADAIVGMGAIALSQWNFEACLQMADKALKINPHHPDAHLLKATCMLAWRKFEKAPPLLEKVLKVNPRHLEALSLMAAAHVRLNDPETAETYAKRVRQINEGYHGLDLAIAEWLAAGRQFDQAEKHYLQAIELAPELAEPLAGLGKMYMQTGEELKAQETLRKAREKDDFREDVANFLIIVDRILDPDRFVVKETENFIIKVDKKYDLVMLDQMADYMEQIYEEVCGDFGHYPDEKTIVEIMPTHQQFSLRIAGRGWIGTVGACTGRVIVLAAPHQKRSQLGLHNWAMVMRHEFTHTVTLSATDNRIPHWFTEACAVWQQPDKRNYRYVQLLVGAVRAKRLFPISEIDWGFIRPKRSGDRSLAYAQSEWMMEYIISQHGFGKISEMLQLFRKGLPQKQVIEKALGVNEKTFDKRFAKWAHAQAEEWGFEVDPAPDLKKAKAHAEKNPENAEAQADYAYALYRRRKIPQADKQADKALKLDENQARALAIKAVVAHMKKDHDKAIQFAGRVEKADPTTSIAPRILARSYIAKRNYVQAIGALELLKQRQPLDSYSYQNLAKIYQQYGQPEKALPNLLHLHRHTMRDPEHARQIAEIYRMLDKDDLALTYFREIAFINPYETSAYESIAAIHMRQRQFDQARQAARNLTLLEPDSAKAWDYMAIVQYRAGQADQDAKLLEEAREAARKSVELDPQGKGPRILDAINRAIEGLEKAA